VEAVKRRLSEKTGLPPELLFLIFCGKLLAPAFALHEYGVQSGSTLHMGQRPHRLLRSAALSPSTPTPPPPPETSGTRTINGRRGRKT
jgi:hypothetical protein